MSRKVPITPSSRPDTSLFASSSRLARLRSWSSSAASRSRSDGEPVALIGQRAQLLFELCRLVPIFEKLTQKSLEAVERRAEPRQSLLQSVSLGHREQSPHRVGLAAS